jgi:hypothetical protein
MKGKRVFGFSRTMFVKSPLSLATVTVAAVLSSIMLRNDPALAADGCPAPSFAAATTNSAGWSPWSVAVGDFNGDGKPDLAAAAADGAWILLGKGDGTFQRALSYGGKAFSIVAGDFNGDGKPDLAVAPFAYYPFPQAPVSILLGNGDGTFKPAGNFRAGSLPYALAVGDFNGDGRLDLAVANFGASDTAGGCWTCYTNGDVSVLLGNGDGTFQPAVNFTVGSNLTSVAAGDFNGDGRLDLAVANQNANSVSILFGNGDGTFKPAVNYGAGTIPRAVSVGDFNADGKPDLAVACYGSWDGISATYTNSGVWVLLGEGDGTFQTAVNYGAGAHSESVAVAIGDFNGDGKLDVTVPGAVLLGNGDGTFKTPVSYGGAGVSVAAADFNGDGKPDLAVAVPGGGFLDPTSGYVYVSLNSCPSPGTHLDIARSKNTATLSWPLPYTNFALEATASVGSTNWHSVPGPPTTNNGRFEITVPLDQERRYFRLRKP